VPLPPSAEDITDTKVNTTDIPKIPSADPEKKRLKSFTGNPEKTDNIPKIIRNKLHKNTKL